MPGSRSGTRIVVLACVLLIVIGTGAAFWVRSGTGASGADVPDPATAVETALPGLPAAATGEPTLPGLATAAPAPGTVARVAGPFDDRFALHDLTLSRAAVTGELEVTSDVSDLLELQVVAGFYDRTGALVGQGRFTYHLDEDTAPARTGPPDERQAFRVGVPAALRGQVASAAVGVPILVNE